MKRKWTQFSVFAFAAIMTIASVFGTLSKAEVEPAANASHSGKAESENPESAQLILQNDGHKLCGGKNGNCNYPAPIKPHKMSLKQTPTAPDNTNAKARITVSKKSGNRLKNYLRLQRTNKILNAVRSSLRPKAPLKKIPEISSQIATISLDNILSTPETFLSQGDVPAQLSKHISNAMTLAKEPTELGFAMAASLADRWDSPTQSEYIFSELIKTCQQLSKGRGLEMTVVMFRSFVQKLKSEKLHQRARLRIGRLYYENGEFGKAVVELDVDQNIRKPSRTYSLAGLVKAIALIRLGQSTQALSLLEWVAEYSQDIKQQARAAFLTGRINLLYNRRDLAEKWLKKVAYELSDQTYCEQAQKLLSQISETRRQKQ